MQRRGDWRRGLVMTEPSKMPLTMIADALLSHSVDLEHDVRHMHLCTAVLWKYEAAERLLQALSHLMAIRALCDELSKHCGSPVDEVSSGLYSHDRDCKVSE